MLSAKLSRGFFSKPTHELRTFRKCNAYLQRDLALTPKRETSMSSLTRCRFSTPTRETTACSGGAPRLSNSSHTSSSVTTIEKQDNKWSIPNLPVLTSSFSNWQSFTTGSIIHWCIMSIMLSDLYRPKKSAKSFQALRAAYILCRISSVKLTRVDIDFFIQLQIEKREGVHMWNMCIRKGFNFERSILHAKNGEQPCQHFCRK